LTAPKNAQAKFSFAATGIGRLTHLTGLLLASKAGIKLEAVPYAGGPAAALTDVIGGRVPLIIEGYSGLAGAIQAHTITALAVGSMHRLPDFPDLANRSRDLTGLCRGRMARHGGATRDARVSHTENQWKPEKGIE
jgi:tripartite-type tricarboxylate transporter receptor subunit TctC